MFFSRCRPRAGSNGLTLTAKGLSRLTLAAGAAGIWLLSSSLIVSSAEAEQAATPAIDANAVAFRVNGKDFTNLDLATASVDFVDELERIPPENRREGLIEILINMTLLADESRKQKIDETPEFKRREEQLRMRSLRNFYIRKFIHPQVTEEATQTLYVDLLARFKPQTELRARHILVDTEEEAKALIEELDKGKDFAELAKEKSTGPTGPNGGDLGFFTAQQMVPAFQEAAAKLKIGEYTKTPVKTQFGWHIIKLEETRQTTAPTYEQVKADLQNKVFNDVFQAKVSELRKTAKIEIVPEPGAETAAGKGSKKPGKP